MVGDRGLAIRAQRRVIVLGASNVTRGLPAFCRAAAKAWGAPLDILAAIGHGRSYGQPSSVLGRVLPSIRSCELWDDWQAREPLPTAALITDIGNDIVYGSKPAQIADWVRECVERLLPHCDRIVITGLPLESVSRVGPRRFRILRAMIFPGSRLTLEQALASAEELHERVAEIAKSLELGWSDPDRSWFGFDPIHIRRRYWDVAWPQMLASWGGNPALTITSDHSLSGWTAARLRPKYRWMFGKPQQTPQPAWHGPDGSRLSLY